MQTESAAQYPRFQAMKRKSLFQREPIEKKNRGTFISESSTNIPIRAIYTYMEHVMGFQARNYLYETIKGHKQN